MSFDTDKSMRPKDNLEKWFGALNETILSYKIKPLKNSDSKIRKKKQKIL